MQNSATGWVWNRRARGAVFAVLVLAAAACGTPPSSAPSVTRVMVGDTLVITTDPGPGSGPSLFTVELDLTIGEADGPEESVLYQASSVSADEEGRIYISDQQDGEVRIFDAHGQFLRRFGRRGDGPGEFNSSSWGWFQVRPVAGRRLTVEDLPRLRIFDDQGVYLSSFDVLSVMVQGERRYASPRGIIWLPERETIVAGWSPDLPDGTDGESLVLLNDSLTVLRELPIREVTGGSYEGEGWGLSLPHGPDYEWAVAGDRVIAWGVSDEYRIDLFDLETDSWTRVVLLLPTDPVTNDDIRSFKEKFLSRSWVQGQEEVWEPRLNRAVYPEVKPYFADLLGDDEGRIWVQRYSPRLGARGEELVRYDLFDGEGQWLGIVDSPVAFEYIWDGYGYRLDYEGFPKAERYRITKAGSSEVR